MNSTQIKLKKFLGNRNTVTILCAIIGIVVLYVGYTVRVNSAIEPVTVPYANTNIQPRTKITEDMISTMQIAKAALDKMEGSVITDKKKIINKFSATNTLIPEGSLFYESAVVDKRPNEAVYQAPKGFSLYYFTVNMGTSYVNTILPNTYVDIYLGLNDETTSLPYVGKYIENVKVLAVKTSDGLDVFEDSDTTRVPAYIIVEVRDDEFKSMLKASRLGYSLTLVPNKNENVDVEDEALMVSDQADNYITSHSEEFEYSGEKEQTQAGSLSGNDNGGTTTDGGTNGGTTTGGKTNGGTTSGGTTKGGTESNGNNTNTKKN